VTNSLCKYDITIGLPLPLLCVILMPVALLILPFLLVSCLLFSVRFGRALGTLAEAFWSLRGTHVEVALSQYAFLIRIT